MKTVKNSLKYVVMASLAGAIAGSIATVVILIALAHLVDGEYMGG